jgi:hypothetical protein
MAWGLTRTVEGPSHHKGCKVPLRDTILISLTTGLSISRQQIYFDV